jgi:DNA-binding MarR family transcriptional regulator
MLEAWWTLMSAQALLMQRVGEDLAVSTYVPVGSYNTLRLLHKAPGGRLRLSELARGVHLTQSGVTRLVNRLERTGLLRREESASDRRSSCAVLTDRGRDEWKRVRPVFVRAVAEHFGSHLSDGETAKLKVILSRIVTTEAEGD